MPDTDWSEQYRLDRSRYESYGTRIKNLIDDLLRGVDVDVVQIDLRIKTVESFTEKIRRKKYDAPFQQMTDIVGVRIVTYYVEDLDRVESLVREQFNVDEYNSVDKSSILDSDQFGYRSRHFVASSSSSRKALPEWQDFSDLSFEIQVRTALQHAWAAVHHKLDYKSVREVPQQLRRRLYRLSALFEIADEQFSALRDSANKIEADYNSQLTMGDIDIDIDVDSLKVYLNSSRIRDRLETIAARVPWGLLRDDTLESRDRSFLIKLCATLGWTKLADIHSVLQISDEHLENLLRMVNTALLEEGTWVEQGTLEDLVETVIMATHADSTQSYIAQVYSDSLRDTLIDVQSRYRGGD